MSTEQESIDLIIPKMAKDALAFAEIQQKVSEIKIRHRVYVADAKRLDMVEDDSVHLILTSPPYWNLKDYNQHEEQLGNIDDYECFLSELDKVWKECFKKLTIG